MCARTRRDTASLTVDAALRRGRAACLALLPFFAASLLGAAEPGERGFNFLRLGENARQAALGGAGVGDDGGAATLNPAGLGRLRAQEVSFSYARFFGDLGMGALGYARPGEKWSLGGSALHMSYGDFEAFTEAGVRSTAEASASDMAVALTAARAGEGAVPGLTLKAARENLDGTSATAWAADAGVLIPLARPHPRAGFWQGHLQRMSLGVSVRNLGPSVSFDERDVALPLSAAVGLSHKSFGGALTLLVDAERHLGRSEGLTLHAGGEYWLQSVLALRVGHRGDTDIGPGLTAGAGFRVGSAQIDYAFTPFDELGDAHRMTLSFRFGGRLLERYYAAGLDALRAGRYAEAVILFDKALVIEPSNPKVLRGAIEAAAGLKKRLEELAPESRESPR